MHSEVFNNFVVRYCGFGVGSSEGSFDIKLYVSRYNL